VELRRLEAERRAGRGAMAGDAVAAAWEYPLGVADLDALAARDEPRVRSVGVPFVAVAAPLAARMMHQQARLDERAVETQVLDEHGARREHPAVALVDRAGETEVLDERDARRENRAVAVADRDRGAVGQREPPLALAAVEPCGRGDIVWDHARPEARRAVGIEAAGIGQPLRHRRPAF